jgi:ATP-dependent Clp protease protease subunit
MEHILATHTSRPVEQIARDTDRDFIMSAEEAVSYGMVDDVLTSRACLPGAAAAVEVARAAAG